MGFYQFMHKCFDLSNPGGKIKKVARIIYIVEVLLTALAAFITIVALDFVHPIISVFIIGPIAAVVAFFISLGIFWPTMILIYGFGELIENTDPELLENRKVEEKASRKALEKAMQEAREKARCKAERAQQEAQEKSKNAAESYTQRYSETQSKKENTNGKRIPKKERKVNEEKKQPSACEICNYKAIKLYDQVITEENETRVIKICYKCRDKFQSTE